MVGFLERGDRSAVRGALRWLLACALAAGIPLSGFTPFNHGSDVLALELHPARVLLMPSVLLAAAALAAAVVAPRRPRVSISLALRTAAVLLLLAACFSILRSQDPTDSMLKTIVAIVAPMVVFVGVMRADLPLRFVCGVFVGVSVLLLIRADIVFFQTHGLPTGQALFAAKFSNAPYDFHYFALQNPIHTALFVLLVLPLVAFWTRDPKIGRLARVALLGACIVLMLTLVLLYVRLAIFVGLLVLLTALLTSGARRATKGVVIAVTCVAATAFSLDPVTSSYLSLTTATDRGSSAEVRLSSTVRGAETMAAHPFTGLGVGWYTRTADRVPAHSSIVQAGAEMGILALAATAFATAWFALRAWGSLRAEWLREPAGASAIATGVYAVHSAFAGGLHTGNGFVVVWGLTLALLTAVSLSEGAVARAPLAPPEVPPRMTLGNVAGRQA